MMRSVAAGIVLLLLSITAGVCTRTVEGAQPAKQALYPTNVFLSEVDALEELIGEWEFSSEDDTIPTITYTLDTLIQEDGSWYVSGASESGDTVVAAYDDRDREYSLLHAFPDNLDYYYFTFTVGDKHARGTVYVFLMSKSKLEDAPFEGEKIKDGETGGPDTCPARLLLPLDRESLSVLRATRDTMAVQSGLGLCFVKQYYRLGYAVCRKLVERPGLQKVLRRGLRFLTAIW